MEKRLSHICQKEKIKVDKEVLRRLASLSEGDLRSAINDLEIISHGRKEITEKDLEVLGYRERETNVFDVLKMIFKTKTALAAKLAINNADKDPDEVFWWIENNIAKEYEEPEEVAKAYDALSMADLFRQRVVSKQNWRMKGYMIDMMTAGVATAKKDMYRKFTRYEYPNNIMILGRTKLGRRAEKEALLKLSTELHCSTKKIRKEFLPFMKIMVKDKQFITSLKELLGQDMKVLLSKN
jgi:replication factor C large subunit